MNTEEKDNDPAPNVVVILCSPSYTPLTGYTGKWLEEVAVPTGIVEHRLTGGAVAFKGLIDERPEGEKKHITIFCGHGIDEALLGPPLNNEEDIQDRYGTRHSIIYGIDRFQPNPKVLFAFCCNSANSLGPRFKATPDASFLGYNGELNFVTCDEQCMATLKTIVKQVAEQIIIDQDINQSHEVLLNDLYQKAYDYYLSGPGRSNPYFWLMTMCLMQHKTLIRRYAGMSA
ncbi:MAG TPA: hypothetical protein VKB05_07080 [Pyrinomonadaceae bacterium]|nr:hypothetical protein [Pyrinomonadaceae bacterium]